MILDAAARSDKYHLPATCPLAGTNPAVEAAIAPTSLGSRDQPHSPRFVSYAEYEALVDASVGWLVFIVSVECDDAARATLRQAQADIGGRAAVFGMCADQEVTPTAAWYPPGDPRPALTAVGPDALRDLAGTFERASGLARDRPAWAQVVADRQRSDDEGERLVATEDLSRFPTTFQMARSLAIDAWRAARHAAIGADVLLPAEDARQRLDICVACDEYDDGRCRSCGCLMRIKAHLATSDCPLAKWGEA